MVKRIQLVHWNLPSKRIHFGAPNFPFTTSDFLGWWYGKCHRSKAFSHYTLDMYTVCYIYPWHGCAWTCGYLIWKLKKHWSLGYPIFRNPNSYSNLATVKLQIDVENSWRRFQQQSLEASLTQGSTSKYGGFHKWEYPNSWMVYFMENPNLK